MKIINEFFLDTIKKGRDKFNISIQNPSLIKESRKVLMNFYHYTKNLKIIELASLLISMNAWQVSKGQASRKNFKTRDIVEVDLGLGHGFEMSYRHPCIVLHNSKDGFCFVVPCSTGKYGKNNKYILDGEVSDGFQRQTGVLIDAVRCVSKVRVTGKVGEISVPFLEKLNNKLLQTYFSRHHHRLEIMSRDLEQQKKINEELQVKLTEIEKNEKNPTF